MVCQVRSPESHGLKGPPASATVPLIVTRSQKARRHSGRRAGTLPAMSAALIAPIEVPTSQSGATPWPWSAS